MAFLNFIKKHWVISISVAIVLVCFCVWPNVIGQLVTGIFALVGLIANLVIGIFRKQHSQSLEKRAADTETAISSSIAGLESTITAGAEQSGTSATRFSEAEKVVGDGADAIERAIESDSSSKKD